MDRKLIGMQGENFAAEYLCQHGYDILARNYREKTGEIDIIAAINGVMVFIEVKTRSSTVFGLPCQAVNYHKQQKILRTAQYYLKKTNCHHRQCRFDVIEVMRENGCYRVHQIENAFE